MAKPKTRSNGICSPLSTVSRVRGFCCDLKTDFDISESLHAASELFFRLTGRQSKYAGSCVYTVYPCKPDNCYCGCAQNPACVDCKCALDIIWLPGACEIVQVVIDGWIVDPAMYVLNDGGGLIATCGLEWPSCNFPAPSRPLSQYTVGVTNVTTKNIVVTPKVDGCYDFVIDGGIPGFDSMTVDTVLQFVGDDGWEWLVPVEGLTFVSTVGTVSTFKYCPVFEFTSVALDAMIAAESSVLKCWKPKYGPVNVSSSLENYSLTVRTYYREEDVDRCGGVMGTFEISYRTGCSVPLEVQGAVAELACELAKARGGDESCRLPSQFRSFKLDGDKVDRIDPYYAMSMGLTGIDSVDNLIKSINPNRLYRRPRLIKNTSGTNLRRFKW